jgi:CrcB protein
MPDIVWVGLGAAIGANARFWLGQVVADRLGTAFPYGTLIINVSGSILIGFIMTVLSDRLLVDSHWRLFIVVGLLGGYTTFSSFSYETLALMQSGRWLPALAYISGSLLFCVAGCYIGVVAAQAAGR